MPNDLRRWLNIVSPLIEMVETNDPADDFEDDFWHAYDASSLRPITRISLHKHAPNVVEINHIEVNKDHRGSGIGNKLLGTVITLADRHGVVLLAGPASDADGEEGLDTQGLADWYGRWDFESTGPGLVMRREPFPEETDGTLGQIDEAAITLPWGQRILVAQNPSPAALIAMVQRSHSKHVRGLVVGSKVIWWDGHDATHGDLAHMVGHDEYTDDRLDMRIRNDLPAIDSDHETFERWYAHPVMRRLFNSPDLYFYAGSHGWLPGPDWMALQANEAPVQPESVPVYKQE